MKKTEKNVTEDPKIKELTDDLQRIRADFENYRKQTEMQTARAKEAVEYATVYKVLPLMDDIDRALQSYQELKPLQKTLEKTLKDLELEKVNSEANVDFNPDLHEAVLVEGDGEKEVIAETLRPGYFYKKQVLRPAMVKVKKI